MTFFCIVRQSEVPSWLPLDAVPVCNCHVMVPGQGTETRCPLARAFPSRKRNGDTQHGQHPATRASDAVARQYRLPSRRFRCAIGTAVRRWTCFTLHRLTLPPPPNTSQHSVPLFAPREEASSPRTAPDLRSVAVWIPPAGSGANDRAGRRTPSMSWPARIRSTVFFCADPPMGDGWAG
jgi:hypothetical protein